MGSEHIPILMLFVFGLLLTGTFVVVSSLLGRPKKSTTDLEPYECGVDQATEPRRPLSVKFFIIAIVFLLFDAELALLYPWASLFRKYVAEGNGAFILVEGLLFIAVLSVGLIYIFRGDALDWEK